MSIDERSDRSGRVARGSRARTTRPAVVTPLGAHTGAAGLQHARPGRAALPRRHNLPAQLNSFVGRERELAELRGLLATIRLLTIVGAGGVGKTRLAQEAAAWLVEDYADGVWLVPLAGLADPALVSRAVASALGVPVGPRRSPAEALADDLRSAELLLVLDNCEHLASACAALAEHLLRVCPGLQVLATSREVLGIAGETTWRLLPLSLPAAGAVPAADPDLTSLVADYGAIRLFVDRARAALPGFSLTAADAEAIADICRQLDGIPLAIELAAARVGMLTARQIAERLTDRFRLLTNGSRTALPQHQTLRALVDWSYDLLPAPEQTLLRRLSVFAGGWTLEAAEGVCGDEGAGCRVRGAGDDGEPLHPADVLPLLSRLLMKSLVVAEEQRGAVRYRLHRMIREYAHERLCEAGEKAALRERHHGWFLSLAERAGPELAGPRQREWYDRLEAEHDNFRAALDWSLGDDARVEVGLRLAVALNALWSPRGYEGEGREWLTRLLARAARPTEVRGEALNRAGYLAFRQGNYAAAEALLEESQALWQALGSRRGLAAAWQYQGMLAHGQGDLARAAALFERCLPVFRELGAAERIQIALANLAEVAYGRADHARAAALFEEGLALARASGNTHTVGTALRGLGLVALAEGDPARATALLKEGLACLAELRDKKCGPFCLEALAYAAAWQGQAERAARLFGAAQGGLTAIGVEPAPAQRADHERGVVAARSMLGAERFGRLWSEGQALTLEQATEFALADERCSGSLLPEALPAADPAGLTPREREVTALIAHGRTNRQIAEELVLSVRTVERHIENIYEKVGAHGKAARAAVTAFALRHRLAEPG